MSLTFEGFHTPVYALGEPVPEKYLDNDKAWSQEFVFPSDLGCGTLITLLIIHNQDETRMRSIMDDPKAFKFAVKDYIELACAYLRSMLPHKGATECHRHLRKPSGARGVLIDLKSRNFNGGKE